MTIGTAITVPDITRAFRLFVTRLMISTPPISSPCTAALSQTVRPGLRPCTIWIGNEICVPVTSREIGSSPVAERPGGTSSSPMRNGSRLERRVGVT